LISCRSLDCIDWPEIRNSCLTCENSSRREDSDAIARSGCSTCRYLPSRLISPLPRALQSLAAPTSPSSLVDLLGSFAPYAEVLAGGIGVVGAGVGTGAASIGTVTISLGIAATAVQASEMAAAAATEHIIKSSQQEGIRATALGAEEQGVVLHELNVGLAASPPARPVLVGERN
jgi:hypothetical protein